MAILSFKVQADYEKVVKLREEITKLETQLKSFGRNTPIDEIKKVETSLSQAKSQFTALSTEAAKAGASMDSKFRKDIREATREVDKFTEQIIEQKSRVKDVEYDVKRLGEAYSKALMRNSSKAPSIKADYDAAKKALEEERAALFGLTQEKAKASLVTKKLKEDYKEFKEEAEESTEANNGFSMSLGKMAGLIGGVTVLKQLGAQIISVRGQFQEMETAISTLVGQDMADKLMPQIREMAKISPLTMTDIVGAEKMMLGFNINAEDTIKYLKALSDVSMGNSQKFNSLTLAFSQMSAAGRLMGQDLNQMINAGFNPLQVISQKTGKSIAQLKDEMSKGAVSAEMVQQAFIDATSAGGKFYKMSENASKTITGQISMMQDAMDAAFNDIGMSAEKGIIKGIQSITSLIQNYETVGKVLAGLVVTYGVYRTAVVAATIAQSEETIVQLALNKAKIAGAAAQTALNKAMLTNPYVLMASVILGLAGAITALELSADSARKYQNSLNKAIKESEAASIGETRELARLKGELAACEKGTEKYEEIKNKIVSSYGKYHSNLAQEIEEVGLLDETYKSLTESISASYSARQFDKFIKEQEVTLDKRLSKSLTKIYDRLVKDLGDDKGTEVYAKVRDALMTGAELDAETVKILNEVQNKGKITADSQIDGWVRNYREEMKAYEKVRQEAMTKFGIKEVKKGDSKTTTPTEDTSTYAEDYEAAKKKYEDDLKAFKWAEENKTKVTTEEYNKRKKQMQTSEEAFKKLGGKTDKQEQKKDEDEIKTYNQQQALLDKEAQVLRNSQKQRERDAKDMEFMIEQTRINAMKDGAEKRRAQRKLDNEKEIEQLERQKQDYIDKVVEQEKAIFDAQEEQKAKDDKNYKKQTFDSKAAREKVDTTAYDKSIKNTQDKQTNQEDIVLKELLDTYKSYTDKKEEIDKQYLADKNELETAYNKTGEEKYKRSLEERHKAYVKAMNELDKEANSEDYERIFRDPSKMDKDGLNTALDLAEKKLKNLIATGAEADVLEPLYEQIKAIREELDNYEISGITSDLTSLVKKATDLEKAKRRLASLDEGSDLYKKEKEAVDRATDDLKKSIAATGVVEFSGLMSKAANAMHQIAQESGDVQMEDLASAFDSASNIINSSVQGLIQGGPMGLLVGLISSAVGEIINLVTEAELADARMANSLANFRRELQLTQLQIDSTDFENIFGTQQFEAANDALLKAKESISLFKEASDELHSLKWKYGTGINWIPEQGVLFETYDKMDYLRSADVWDEEGLLDIEKAEAYLSTSETITDEARKQVEYAIELRKAYDAAQDALENFVSSYVGDTSSNITDAIFEGIDNGSDAWDIFEQKGAESIRALGKNMLKEIIQKDLTETWSDSLLYVAGDPKEMARTYSEMMLWLASRMEDYQSVANAWETAYGDLFDSQSDLQQQEASRKGYETLSEDTGNELVGRALAQYESNLRMEEATRSMKESVDLMAANQVQIRDIAADSRTIIANSYLELQQIRENTGAIIKPINEMNQRISEWDSKIKSL